MTVYPMLVASYRGFYRVHSATEEHPAGANSCLNLKGAATLPAGTRKAKPPLTGVNSHSSLLPLKRPPSQLLRNGIIGDWD